MVFEFLKNLHNDALRQAKADTYEAMHEEAFLYLQKNFGAYTHLTLNSEVIQNKKILAKEIYESGGSIYDFYWLYHFRVEFTFASADGIDEQKMRIYEFCKDFYRTNKFKLESTLSEVPDAIQKFEDIIPAHFSFKEFEVTPKYKEEVKDGRLNGQHTDTYSNGDTYDGEWKDGKPHGQGIKDFFESGAQYNGEWKDGKYHGQGTYTFSNCDQYDGEWKDGKQHGHGIYTFSNGSQIDGEWKDGQRTK